MKIKGFCGVLFWLNRVSEEHNKLALQRLKRCQDLSFQVLNYEEMPERVKESVIKDLIKDMKEFGWEDTLKEYFPSQNSTKETKE